jgi:predicted permease
MLDTFAQDVRYALRGVRRAPLFAATASATIGLGLGILCSAFTLLNAYLLRPIDLPNARTLVGVSWDTETVRRHRFAFGDFEALQADSPHLAGLAGGVEATAMRDGVPLTGLLVTGRYFEVLGGRPALGRTLHVGDGAASSAQVVVLSDRIWRSRYGADPALLGTSIELGRGRFVVVGIMPAAFRLGGEAQIGFWAPLAAAGVFGLVDPGREPEVPRLRAIGRLRQTGSEPQLRAWLETWLDRRFPVGSPDAPTVARVESLATLLPRNRATLTMLAIILSACGLVLLVACANVTNLLLARALTRQRELAVRLSLGSSRWRVVRQLVVESLVLAVPAAAVGFGLTIVMARAFPALVVNTFPEGIGPIEAILMPLDPDLRVVAFLCVAAVVSALLVSLAPASRMARIELSRASRGEAGWDVRRSRLRTGLVAMQIGACVLFLVGATGLVDEAQRLANPDAGVSYQRVASVQVDARLRAAVAARLNADPSVERVAAARQPPLSGPLPRVTAAAPESGIAHATGFMLVSPEYFSLFDIQILRGRTFTAVEADENTPLALVSADTAQTLWPGLDPIGRTLELRRSGGGQPDGLPGHASVRVIGVTEDVPSGTLLDGADSTCVYLAIGFAAPGPTSLLVRSRGENPAALRNIVTAAVNAIEPDAAFRFVTLPQLVSGLAWVRCVLRHGVAPRRGGAAAGILGHLRRGVLPRRAADPRVRRADGARRNRGRRGRQHAVGHAAHRRARAGRRPGRGDGPRAGDEQPQRDRAGVRMVVLRRGGRDRAGEHAPRRAPPLAAHGAHRPVVRAASRVRRGWTSASCNIWPRWRVTSTSRARRRPATCRSRRCPAGFASSSKSWACRSSSVATASTA